MQTVLEDLNFLIRFQYEAYLIDGLWSCDHGLIAVHFTDRILQKILRK